MSAVKDQFGRELQEMSSVAPVSSPNRVVEMPKMRNDLPVREDAPADLADVDTCRLGKCVIPKSRPAKVPRDTKLSVLPLWQFPLNVNDNVIRLVGAQVVIICIIGLIFRNENWMHYVFAGLCVDYALRMYGGSKISLLGNVAELIASFMPRKMVPGPPKQFASLCGVMFSGIASILFFSEEDIGGSIVIGMLLGAAFCESAIGFCFGCWFFHLFRKIGLVSETIQTKAFAAFPDIAYALDLADTRLNEGLPPEHVHHFKEGETSKADIFYKAKTDDMTRENQHLVKYTHISYFGMALALNGLAVAWRVADPDPTYDVADGYWETLVIMAAVVFCLVGVLYVLKCVMYPKKVFKEWMSLIHNNFFSLITINLLLFAFHALEDEPDLASVIFWVAAPLQMLHAVSAITTWLTRTHNQYFVSPAYMVPVLGNLVAAIVAPAVRSPEFDWKTGKFLEVGWLFFSMALFMWIVLFTITFQRQMNYESVDQKLKPSFANYVGAPAVAGLAWLALHDGVWDDFALFLYFTSWGFVLCLIWMSYKRFFGKPQFNMGDWGYVFPLAAHAALSITYSTAQDTQDNYDFSLFAMALANGIGAICFIATLVALANRRLFVAEDKWGPFSFMKLTHEYLKNCLDQLVKYTYRLDGSSRKSAALLDLFENFTSALEGHAHHEDDILYVVFDAVRPGVQRESNRQHEHGHKLIGQVRAHLKNLAVQDYSADEWDPISQQTENLMAEFLVDLQHHFRYEEDHLNCFRKHVPIELQAQTVRKMFYETSTSYWVKTLPFAMEHMPTHAQRVRYLKCFRWIMPERLHHLGRYLYHELDACLWDRLARDVPEIIPRGVPGYRPSPW